MRSPWAYCRPRPSARWALAEPQVRVEGAVTLGKGTRLLRGATVMGNGGFVIVGRDGLIARWSVVQAAGGSISIGDRSSVGDFSNLYGQGGLVVGNDVLIASGVRIHSAEHLMDRRDVPIRLQGERTAATTIGDGAWLAANVLVLAGVTVGEGAVCAAGAVVTRDVAPYAVVAGIPARVLKQRDS